MFIYINFFEQQSSILVSVYSVPTNTSLGVFKLQEDAIWFSLLIAEILKKQLSDSLGDKKTCVFENSKISTEI